MLLHMVRKGAHMCAACTAIYTHDLACVRGCKGAQSLRRLSMHRGQLKEWTSQLRGVRTFLHVSRRRIV